MEGNEERLTLAVRLERVTILGRKVDTDIISVKQFSSFLGLLKYSGLWSKSIY